HAAIYCAAVERNDSIAGLSWEGIMAAMSRSVRVLAFGAALVAAGSSWAADQESDTMQASSFRPERRRRLSLC
ncbi:MAG TPA: hypothetical protein VHD86_23880, partial [Xanthobacteraceae bacterium]|nr:hypothetical protein [Xanthobacteraceae bacterium]